ncbi:aldo/keto reductase [Actinoplanes sp. NPDC049118]|uniref:aldo/keto reductase n=1 Tax=Actinoplanes sp. NPDC049118 TaxID=3155769 RepID=UPI0033FA64C3
MRRVPGIDMPISAIGAGCWTIGGPATNGRIPIGWDDADPAAALDGLRCAYEHGVRLFDTADVYGMGQSERLLGILLAEISRHEAIVSSKVGYFAGRGTHPYDPAQMREQFHRSLERLGTDYLDIYFLHSSDFGPQDVRLAEAVQVISDLRRQGLIRAVGLRAPHDFAVEWANQDLGKASRQAARFMHLFTAVQPDVLTVRHNLLSYEYADDETDVFAFARRRGVGVLTKQALAQGILLDTHDPDQPRSFSAYDHRSADPAFRQPLLRAVRDGLARARQSVNADPSLFVGAAIGYALQRADAAVLVGFRNAAQIRASIEAAAQPIDAGDIQLVHRSLRPARAILHADLHARRHAPADHPPITLRRAP